eukprot:TRINITY_DN5149_c0_g1_i2.p1 TRINITY_DN5149_c0_g1~~TRINITY_DN5149_c0_g1_i2.p1  ORF type:complete len:412 (-),score=40.16 TRINITY_DN5149_c0_g1_i2:1038-2273(-)
MKSLTPCSTLMFVIIFTLHFLPQLHSQSQSSINQLGLQLLTDICDQNCIFSPYSIHTALTMTMRGSNGQTRAQFLAVLSPTNSFTSTNNLLQQNEDYDLNVANGIFVDAQFPLSREYQTIIETEFDGVAERVSFSQSSVEATQIINDFVKTNTEGQISKLLPAGAVSPMTRAVIVNAVFFKGVWQTIFQEDATMMDAFMVGPTKKKMVPMMFTLGNFRIGSLQRSPQVSFIELPYEGDDISMFILIAKSLQSMNSGIQDQVYVSIDVLGEQLLQEDGLVEQLLSSGTQPVVELTMPKFTLEFDTELSGPLQRLGIVDAFSPGVADFSEMLQEDSPLADDLYISEGFHKAKIIVDEEGTTAAAATGIVITERSAGIRRQDVFTVDQPFVFMLLHKPTASVLFMGQVTDPSKE